MKKISLIGPTIVRDSDAENAGQKVRYPYENPILVTDGEAHRLEAAGALLDEPTDAENPPADEGAEPSQA